MNKKLRATGKTPKSNGATNSGETTNKRNDNKGFKINVWQKQMDRIMNLKSVVKTYVNPMGDLEEIFAVSDISKLKNKKGMENVVEEVFDSLVENPRSGLDDSLPWLLKTIGEFCGIDRASLFLFHSNYRYLTNSHEWCAEGINSLKDKIQDIPTSHYLWSTRKTRNREAIIVNDIEKLPKEASLEHLVLNALGIASIAVVPITIRKKTIGFLGFESHSEKNNWDRISISLLKAIGEIIGIALVLNKD